MKPIETHHSLEFTLFANPLLSALVQWFGLVLLKAMELPLDLDNNPVIVKDHGYGSQKSDRI